MGFELYILRSIRLTHIESVLFNKGTDFRGELWLLVRDDYLRSLLVEALIINTTSLRYLGDIPGDGAGVRNTAHENYLVRQHLVTTNRASVSRSHLITKRIEYLYWLPTHQTVSLLPRVRM